MQRWSWICSWARLCHLFVVGATLVVTLTATSVSARSEIFLLRDTLYELSPVYLGGYFYFPGKGIPDPSCRSSSAAYASTSAMASAANLLPALLWRSSWHSGPQTVSMWAQLTGMAIALTTTG